MRKRQVGEDAVEGIGRVAESGLHGFAHKTERAKGLHDSLGLARRPRGVDDSGEVLGRADRLAFEGPSVANDALPVLARGRCVVWPGVGKSNELNVPQW